MVRSIFTIILSLIFTNSLVAQPGTSDIIKLEFVVVDNQGNVLKNACVSYLNRFGDRILASCCEQANEDCFLLVNKTENLSPLLLFAVHEGYQERNLIYNYLESNSHKIIFSLLPIQKIIVDNQKEEQSPEVISNEQVDSSLIKILVTDILKQPLEGVTISYSSTEYKWFTDQSGRTNIKTDLQPGDKTNFSFYLNDYQTETVPYTIKGKTTSGNELDVVMKKILPKIDIAEPDTIPRRNRLIRVRAVNEDLLELKDVEVSFFYGETQEEKKVITDEDGYASVSFLIAKGDSLLIRAAHPSYFQITPGEFHVVEESFNEITISMKNHTLRGQVIHKGRFVKGLSVIVTNKRTNKEFKGKTDADGTFVLTNTDVGIGDFLEFKFKKGRFDHIEIKEISSNQQARDLKFKIEKNKLNWLKFGSTASLILGGLCGGGAVYYYFEAKDCCDQHWDRKRKNANGLIVASASKIAIGGGLLWLEKELTKNKIQESTGYLKPFYQKDQFGHHHLGLSFNLSKNHYKPKVP